MKYVILCLLSCITFKNSFAQSTEKEKAAKAYYLGFENHNWSAVSGQFSSDFTFTSPNNDDHISITKFKEKCWGTNKFFKKVNFIKMTESGNELILLVEINTTDNKLVRNVDIFTFNGSKIKSVETFFGRGKSFPGNSK